MCVHGYSGNARDFDFLAQRLKADYRVVCVDVAGRGDSDWLPAATYGFPQFLTDLNTLLARLGTRQVDWVGTSMGGLLGMLLASQPHSPIRRLVMNDVGAYLPTPALQEISRNLIGPTFFSSAAAVEAHLKRTLADWGPIGPDEWKALVKTRRRKVANGYRLAYDPAIANLVQPVPLTPGLFFWDAWGRVKCPALLIRGEASAVFPRVVADAMLKRNPKARLEEIPGVGHAPSLMVPTQAALIREFLEPPRAKVRHGLASPLDGARRGPDRLSALAN